jgi:hypothetical protein
VSKCYTFLVRPMYAHHNHDRIPTPRQSENKRASDGNVEPIIYIHTLATACVKGVKEGR